MQVKYIRAYSRYFNYSLETMFSAISQSDENALELYVEFPADTNFNEIWQRVFECQAKGFSLEITTHEQYVVLTARGREVDEVIVNICRSLPPTRHNVTSIIYTLLTLPYRLVGIPSPETTPVYDNSTGLIKKIEDVVQPGSER